MTSLQKKWEKILEREGLEIVKPIKKTKLYQNISLTTDVQARRDYYYQLGQCIAHYDFQNYQDREILVLHAEGKKIVEIVRELKEAGITLHRKTVGFIIRRYEHQWKIRLWNPKQMKLLTA